MGRQRPQGGTRAPDPDTDTLGDAVVDPLRLLKRPSEPEKSAIRLGGEMEATERWTSLVPGRSSHVASVHGPGGCLYVSDGWGVAYASIRFRRLDVVTGIETASFRSGTAVRCFAMLVDGDELIASTDSRLFRLDAVSLAERERWDTRIPRYSNTMAIRGDLVVVANWRDPKIGIIDLATGRVRRRAAPEMTTVLDGPADPLLVGGHDGGVVSIDPVTGTSRRILDTPAALDAALSKDRRTLWLTVGVRAVVSSSSVRPGSPARELRQYAIDDAAPPTRYHLPSAVRGVVAGATRLWLVGEGEVLSVPLPLGPPARVWRSPKGHDILAVDPDAGLMVTTRRDVKGNATPLTCFRTGD
jgi:hypothetical protein